MCPLAQPPAPPHFKRFQRKFSNKTNKHTLPTARLPQQRAHPQPQWQALRPLLCMRASDTIAPTVTVRSLIRCLCQLFNWQQQQHINFRKKVFRFIFHSKFQRESHTTAMGSACSDDRATNSCAAARKQLKRPAAPTKQARALQQTHSHPPPPPPPDSPCPAAAACPSRSARARCTSLAQSARRTGA